MPCGASGVDMFVQMLRGQLSSEPSRRHASSRSCSADLPRSYTNTPDPKRAAMTGTTRDGTFLIEDGAVTRALANVRYRMSTLDLFAGIDALGQQRLVRDWWSSNGMGSIVCLAPPVRVSRATITGSSPI